MWRLHMHTIVVLRVRRVEALGISQARSCTGRHAAVGTCGCACMLCIVVHGGGGCRAVGSMYE